MELPSEAETTLPPTLALLGARIKPTDECLGCWHIRLYVDRVIDRGDSLDSNLLPGYPVRRTEYSEEDKQSSTKMSLWKGKRDAFVEPRQAPLSIGKRNSSPKVTAMGVLAAQACGMFDFLRQTESSRGSVAPDVWLFISEHLVTWITRYTHTTLRDRRCSYHH